MRARRSSDGRGGFVAGRGSRIHWAPVIVEGAPPELSIIVCTLRREAFLRALLDALTTQTGALPRYEIVVVDNDPAGSARPWVAAFTGGSASALGYEHEARPGVSHARNRGVACARGEALLFLDDDQRVADEFVAALWSAWSRRPLPLCGLRLALEEHFEAGVRASQGAARHLGRARVPDYAPVDRASFGTGGLIVERHVLASEATPFRPELGLSGGEDTDLFLRLSERGYAFGHLTSVSVGERVTTQRVGVSYLVRRQIRSGGLDAALDRDAARRTRTRDAGRAPDPAESRRLRDLRRDLAALRDGFTLPAPRGLAALGDAIATTPALDDAIGALLASRFLVARIVKRSARIAGALARGGPALELQLQDLAYGVARLHGRVRARWSELTSASATRPDLHTTRWS